jgi:DNA-binding IclR family transcriptional regulator
MQVFVYFFQAILCTMGKDMSKTLLRGLSLIEVVDLEGPLTISEIARHTGIELSTVSRTVAACEPDGWLVREEGKIATGPRCALLGLTSPATYAIRAAEPLVRAITAATGVSTSASALVGREVMVLASEMAGAAVPVIAAGLSSRIPLHVLADGQAIAAQLTPAQLDKLLPAEPYPGAGAIAPRLSSAVTDFVASVPGAARAEPDLIRTRAELDGSIGHIRGTGFSRDHGRLHPNLHCIARPWPAAGLPAAFACIGIRDAIAARLPLIEACLTAATEPGATSQDVIRTAARAAPA